MIDSSYTKQERQLIVALRIWAVVFLLIGIGFTFYPNGLLEYFTRLGQGFFGWNEPPFEQLNENFWLFISISAAFTLSYLAFTSQANRLRSVEITKSIIIFTFICTAGFAFQLFFRVHRFIYLIGASLNFLVFFTTSYYYSLAARSRIR